MLNPLLYFIVKNYRFINDNQSARDNDNMIKSYYNTNTSFLNGYNITSKSMNATFENLLTTLNVQYYQNDNTSLYLCGLVMGTCSMLGSKSIDAVIEQCESMYSKEINQYKKLFVAHCNKNKINYIDIHNQSYNPKHDCKKLFDKINQDIRGNYNYEDFMTNLLHCMNPTYLLKDSYSIDVLISNKFYSHDPFDIHHKIQSYAKIFTFNNRYIKPPSNNN